jgi:hypothetical protein
VHRQLRKRRERGHEVDGPLIGNARQQGREAELGRDDLTKIVSALEEPVAEMPIHMPI